MGIQALHHVDQSLNARVTVDHRDSLFKDELHYTYTATSPTVVGPMTPPKPVVAPKVTSFDQSRIRGTYETDYDSGTDFDDDDDANRSMISSRTIEMAPDTDFDNHDFTNIYGTSDSNRSTNDYFNTASDRPTSITMNENPGLKNREALLHMKAAAEAMRQYDSSHGRFSGNSVATNSTLPYDDSTGDYIFDNFNFAGIYSSNQIGVNFEEYNIFSKEKDITGFASI